jgi:hypothetical protein
MTDLRADGDTNGKVEAADYTFWKQRFGQVAGASASALDTPEPSGFVWPIAFVAVAALWRRKR